jgi:hypothetical protein
MLGGIVSVPYEPQPSQTTTIKVLAFILDFATARTIRKSLELPAQEPEPLAHGPPCELELLDQTA